MVVEGRRDGQSRLPRPGEAVPRLVTWRLMKSWLLQFCESANERVFDSIPHSATDGIAIANSFALVVAAVMLNSRGDGRR